jgi:hypothetical protein
MCEYQEIANELVKAGETILSISYEDNYWNNSDFVKYCLDNHETEYLNKSIRIHLDRPKTQHPGSSEFPGCDT